MPEEWTGEVKGLMHVHRVKHTELAEALGWNPKYLSAVLNGRRKPKDAEAKVTAALKTLLSDRN